MKWHITGHEIVPKKTNILTWDHPLFLETPMQWITKFSIVVKKMILYKSQEKSSCSCIKRGMKSWWSRHGPVVGQLKKSGWSGINWKIKKSVALFHLGTGQYGYGIMGILSNIGYLTMIIINYSNSQGSHGASLYDRFFGKKEARFFNSVIILWTYTKYYFSDNAHFC